LWCYFRCFGIVCAIRQCLTSNSHTTATTTQCKYPKRPRSMHAIVHILIDFLLNLLDEIRNDKIKLSVFDVKMSSSHQYMQNASAKDSDVVRLGDIEHLSQLSENLSSLCLSHEYADITLIVEGQKLYAHKVVASPALGSFPSSF
jgi:hypothetical protein